jgi:hypothetical protein
MIIIIINPNKHHNYKTSFIQFDPNSIEYQMGSSKTANENHATLTTIHRHHTTSPRVMQPGGPDTICRIIKLCHALPHTKMSTNGHSTVYPIFQALNLKPQSHKPKNLHPVSTPGFSDPHTAALIVGLKASAVLLCM